MKLFRKKLLGRGVCLSLVTRSLKRTHLALTVRDVTDINSLDAIYLMVWARLPKCKSHFFLILNICGDVRYVNFDKR